MWSESSYAPVHPLLVSSLKASSKTALGGQAYRKLVDWHAQTLKVPDCRFLFPDGTGPRLTWHLHPAHEHSASQVS